MDTSMRERLARYQALRAVHMDLHRILMDQLPKNALQECGKLMGVIKGGALVLGSQNEMAALMDYCIYDYRWDGRTVIDRYINQISLEDGSDRRILLDAMQKVRYSLFAVDEVVKGAGVQVRDLFRVDSGFIMDVGMSETVVKNAVFACRIIAPGTNGFSMVTSGVLFADRAILAKIISEISTRFGETSADIARFTSQQPEQFSASILRIFLKGNASPGSASINHVTK
jgi:hypothetical protein